MLLETAIDADNRLEDRAGTVLSSYQTRLERSALAPATRTVYARQVRRFLAWLVAQPGRSGALDDAAVRDWAVRDWRRELATVDRLAPSTVNASLAAVDDLYEHLGLGPARRVPRDRPTMAAPRALDEGQLRRLLRAIEARRSPRDRAAVALMAFAGLRVSEVAALDVADVSVTARTGRVIVRHSKGDTSRTVPLSGEARDALREWLGVRPGNSEGPLFPGPDGGGGRLTVRSLCRLVTVAGAETGISVSPHALRHTFVTRLVRKGTDLALVADLAGHRRIETTRRYALPSEPDRQAAVELLELDY